MISGIVFIVAGLVAYYRISIGLVGAIFVIGGGAVIVLTVLGHRAHGVDIALFIISLLVLATAGTSFGAGGISHASYYGARSSIQVSQIDVTASTSLGSINVAFTSNPNTGYEVTFTRTSFFGFFPIETNNYTFTNVTSHGVLYLNASAEVADISITVGQGYSSNVEISSATGSVSLSTDANRSFGSVALSSNTGSVDANLASSRISSLSLHANTGSVNLRSTYLVAAGRGVPIQVSANTGSVSLNLKIPSTNAMAVNATTSFGSITHELPGFVVTESTNTVLVATTENILTANSSFALTASANTGSVSIHVERLS